MRRAGVLLGAALTTALAAHAQVDASKVNAYVKTLPPVAPPVYDEARRETLATASISCADHPQEQPSNRNNFLWQWSKPAQILEGYDKNRSFFGCSNWHESVASVWMLVSLLNQDPKIGLASDIKDITTTHFKASNNTAELNFFNNEKPIPGGNYFERPYGYAWLIKLNGEAKAGTSADDKKLTEALTPLAKWMSERLVFYLYNLKFAFRTGVEANTAWTMSLALDGAALAEDDTLKNAVHDNALRLFSKDKNCPTNFEPQNADLLSACLTEAALMGRVMEPAAFVKWLDAFLPPAYAEDFQVYAKGTDTSHTLSTGPDAQVQELARSRLVALNFQRAAELQNLSYALPKDDPRTAAFRHLALLDAASGYSAMTALDYEGRNLGAIYALLFENARKGPAPLGPAPKPKEKGAAKETAESQP